MFKKIILPLIIYTSLSSYELENKLETVIIGKVAKYVEFEDIRDNKYFVITVIKPKNQKLFKTIYKDKKIHHKPVKINFIDSIDELENTNVLYIVDVTSKELSEIIQKTKNKNILTISDTRGFVQKGGILQLYFASQKIKIKLNIHSAKKHNIKIKPMLLRISNIEGKA